MRKTEPQELKCEIYSGRNTCLDSENNICIYLIWLQSPINVKILITNVKLAD